MAAGQMESAQYPELGYTPCIDGFAAAIPGDKNNTFQCNNIDLYHFLSHADLGSWGGRGSSSWGWTSADGREFVAIGQYDGTAFAEITSEGKLSYVGRLPQYGRLGSNWREIRIVNDLLVVGSEAIEHGVQFFDMKKILDLDPANPKNFTQAELTGHWDELPVGRTHNIVVNQELNYAIAAGSVGGNETIRVRDNLPCRGGLIFLDISDPTNVTSPGCAAADGYVHDAECVVYRGPDERYFGRDICYAYNEDTFTIYDVTNKEGNNTKIISISDYPGIEYAHQGAVNNLTWQASSPNQGPSPFPYCLDLASNQIYRNSSSSTTSLMRETPRSRAAPWVKAFPARTSSTSVIWRTPCTLATLLAASAPSTTTTTL